MSGNYNEQHNAQAYEAFLNSADGKIQQHCLAEAIQKRLTDRSEQTILDAGCGTGWLTSILSKQFPNVEGCDGSEALLAVARKNYPETSFTQTDLEQPLPYSNNYFDVVILNMVATDVGDQPTLFKNLVSAMKPDGQLIITIPNPYYAYPVGEWKQSLLGKILHSQPMLKLRSYFAMTDGNRMVTSNKKFSTTFYTLAETMNHALGSGLQLLHFEELRSDHDSSRFNLDHQLYRFPLILLLEFKKLL
jgi:trans-aconitate methyltransferase